MRMETPLPAQFMIEHTECVVQRQVYSADHTISVETHVHWQ